MSLGLAIMFEETVILVSDGKETSSGLSEPTYTDDNNKLTLLEPSLVIMQLGLSQISERALKDIQSNYKPNFTYERFLLLIRACLNAAWKYTVFPADTDFNNPHLQSGFLAGGFTGDERFITAIIYNRKGQVDFQVHNQAPELLVSGTGQELAADMCQEKVLEVLRNWNPESGLNERNNRVIECAAETIRFVESRESMVGGTIRYTIVERGQPYLTGIYE